MSPVSSPARPVTTRFGTFDAAPADVVTIPDGLPGFEHCRRYVLLSSPDLAPLTCLQGLDEGGPSFLAIDPRLVVPGYDTTLAASDRRRLSAGEDDALLWLALVRSDGHRTLVNMASPVVVNPPRMLALQVVSADSSYSTHHELLIG